MSEERVDDIPCPWCEATISVPVTGKSRSKRCYACLAPIRIVDRSRVGGAVRIDREES
jgi:hypothetical protein